MEQPRQLGIKAITCVGTVTLVVYLYAYTTNDTTSPAPAPVGHRFPNPSANFMLFEKPAVPPWWQEILCKQGGHETFGGPQSVPVKQLYRDVIPTNGSNVFLLDTACNPNPKYRVWCAVESWARHNPGRQVWFLLTAGRMEDGRNLTSELLQQHKNLHVVTANLPDLFWDTPLLKLFESRKWAQKSTWPVELLSDMLRVLVLWHWGGVYTDTDVISLRKLTLPLNSLGFENPEQIGSSFYSFTAHHPTLHKLMQDMVYNFKPNIWGCIGPKAISRVMEKECGKKLNSLSEESPVTCPGNITLHPTTTFSPVRYNLFEQYFEPGGGKDFDKRYKSAFALHFWNKMSKNRPVEVNSGSVYEAVAQRSCPITYRAATANSNVF